MLSRKLVLTTGTVVKYMMNTLSSLILVTSSKRDCSYFLDIKNEPAPENSILKMPSDVLLTKR